MKNIENIFKRVEIKVGILFGIVDFFIVLLFGLINKIDFLVILKRIFITEIFYIPLGVGIGFLYTSNFKNILKQKNKTLTNSDIEEEKGPAPNVEENTEEELIVDNTVEEEVAEDISSTSKGGNLVDTVVDEDVSHLVNESTTSRSSTKENLDNSHIKKTIDNKNFGRHIIIDDKKIVNDPKLMAQAVRTMMNKEE